MLLEVASPRNLFLAALIALAPLAFADDPTAAGPAEEAARLVSQLTDPAQSVAAGEALVRLGASAEVVEALAGALREAEGPAADAVHGVVARLQAGPGVAAALVRALADERPEVRTRAAIALGALGPAAAPSVPALVAWLEAEQVDPEVRRSVAYGLFRMGPVARAALPALLAVWREAGDPRLMVVAAQAAGRVGQSTPDDLQLLLAGLGDTSLAAEVRGALARYLAPAAPGVAEVALPTLLALLETAPKDVCSALRGFGPEGRVAIAPLTVRIQGRRPDLAAMALGALGPLAGQTAPALARLLGEGDPASATAAAKALGQLGPYGTTQVPALRAGLRRAAASGDHGLSQAIMDSLGELALVSQPARAALLEAAREDPVWRHVVLVLIEPLGPRAADCLPAVEAWAAEEDTILADAARELLTALRDDGWSEDLPEHDATDRPKLEAALRLAETGPREVAVRAFWELAGNHRYSRAAREALAWLDAHPVE